jgi:H+-transporting ATPase
LSTQDSNKISKPTNLELGLESEEIKKRLEDFGYNEVPERTEKFWLTLGKRFWGIVPWMLEITIILTLVLGKYIEAAVIIALLLFNAGMSQWREGKAKKAMTMLKQRLSIESRVKRDGKWLTIPARELVPGDLVRVRIGDLLPADIKIVDGSLSLDQSALTGESGIVDRYTDEIAYSGSAIKRGEATAIVNATGIKTYFGKTISLLDLARPKLHMEEVAVKVARRLAVIVLASLLTVFVYAGLTGFELTVLIPLAIVMLIAIVPVAMPTMFTINMALGSAVLAKQGVLVTRLNASEDAATMDVLCMDKTGTVTMNKLFVEEQVPLNGFSQNDVLLYGALASKEANQDPIDLAFLTATAEANISFNSHVQVEFLPFDPKIRMTQATVQTLGEIFYVTKGSFETICIACNVEQEFAEKALKLVETLSAKGLRVIAVAKGKNRNSLQLVGLAGIADRIKEDSRETIKQIRELGISIKMLTGDSLPVAKNIAQRIGLGKNVVQMARLHEVELKTNYASMIEGSHGIAQVYPEDKFSIVKTLQDAQHVVGMTGDGVNDAPALAQAEVGIAVKNATDIAKDSASAVLTSEGLGGIMRMIRISRSIYQRIYSWTLQMVTRKIHIAFFIVAMLFLTHSLMLSLTSTLLILFLADFATLSMSTDNVRSSLKPDKFNMRTLFGTGAALGILMTIESALFAVPALSYFGILGNMQGVYTFGFAYLNFAGIFAILILRERGHFWESRPSTFLSVTLFAEILIVSAISLLGILELASLGYAVLFAIFGFTLLTTFLINDPIKVLLIHKLKGTTEESSSE